MYEELIKLINICLADNEISEKERTVIFNKAKQLGISEEECEVIIDSMVAKVTNKITKSDLQTSHNFTPKTITKISPPELNMTLVLEKEKQQHIENQKLYEIQRADLQKDLSRLKQEMTLLESENADKYMNAFCVLNDNVLVEVENDLTNKSKFKVTLNDCKLNYSKISKLATQIDLVNFYSELLCNANWDMYSYKKKLEKSKKTLKYLIWIFAIFLWIGSMNEVQLLFSLSFCGLSIAIVLKLINRGRLKSPIKIVSSDIQSAIIEYFNNKFNFDLFFELAKTYKLAQKI